MNYPQLLTDAGFACVRNVLQMCPVNLTWSGRVQ